MTLVGVKVAVSIFIPGLSTVPAGGLKLHVPGIGAVVSKPEVPVVVNPESSVDAAVAFNCAEVSGVSASMVVGAGQVMVGVNGHPGGVHEYGLCQFKVVHGAHVPPWLVVLSAKLNVTLTGSVTPDAGRPLVVEKPANPGLPAPGFDFPRAKK